MRCPQRDVSNLSEPFPEDHWEATVDGYICSYCQSLGSQSFMTMVRNGAVLTSIGENDRTLVTNLYNNHRHMFSYAHMTDDHRRDFAGMFLDNQIKFSGDAYGALPYFIKVASLG